MSIWPSVCERCHNVSVLNILIRLLSNILALYAADYLVGGFAVNGGWHEYVLAGIILGLLNLIVKPILKTVSFPIIVLTLGLFTLIINAALIWLVAYFFPFVTYADWMGLLWATVVVTLVNLVISHKL